MHQSWCLERSGRAAEGFLRELERGLVLIAEHPKIWPSYEAGTRRYILRRYPYSIIYREEAGRIVVTAVAHHRRRPLYWVER